MAKHLICTDECRKLSRSARKAGLAINVAFSAWLAGADLLIDTYEWMIYLFKEWDECLMQRVAQLNRGRYIIL